MRHLKSSILIIAVMAGTPFLANAIGLPKLPGTGGGSEAAASDLTGQQEKIVTDFVAANKDVLAANQKMAEALGLKSDSAKAAEKLEALTAAPTKGNLSDLSMAVDADSKAIAEKIATNPQLSAESKLLYADGLVSLVSGVGKYAGMKDSVASFSSGLTGASVLQMNKLQAGAYIAKEFPGNLMTLGSTMKSAVTFAKSAQIPIPKNAADVMNVL